MTPDHARSMSQESAFRPVSNEGGLIQGQRLRPWEGKPKKTCHQEGVICGDLVFQGGFEIFLSNIGEPLLWDVFEERTSKKVTDSGANGKNAIPYTSR
jgi:hypothetical protein